MSLEESLRAQHDLLTDAYQNNIASARTIQQTLLNDILPGLVDELELDEESEARARLWLNDLESMFRLFKRHKFTVPFTLEHARDTLLWRLAVIPADLPPRPPSFIQCLPLEHRDPCGRPVIVVRLAQLFQFSGDVREALVHYMERLRLNLQLMNRVDAREDGNRMPILQYVALLDIGGISVQNANMDLMTWYIFELVPRFPGMLAAVFILNYSWAHSGLWNIVKRVLPQPALARVFFPSGQELLQCMPPAGLPQEYGGALPSLSALEDPLANVVVPTAPPAPSPSQCPQRLPPSKPEATDAAASGPPSTTAHLPRVGSIAATSHLNPYFGYPVSGRDAITPRLRHGRQRKRDLLRTLAGLWWARWKQHVYAVLCVAFALLVILSSRRRRSTPMRILRWKLALRRLPGSASGSGTGSGSG
ncbi:CRAL/TRIO domain-containing protein [Cubamyces sp. BRFM 1775]|nr:CRAL/TRIO domain-containing protein [Cubamyces sp. BRFM 1775]